MGVTSPLRAPIPLAPEHLTEGFACGDDLMDTWLKRRALANQLSGASRTYVVLDHDNHVAAYDSLATGAVVAASTTGRNRCNMPDPVPVAVLARLAADTRHQGRGLGPSLVGDALRRVLAAAEILGIRGVVVHALSPDLRAFYTGLGFSPSPLDDLLLMVTLPDVRAALA